MMTSSVSSSGTSFFSVSSTIPAGIISHTLRGLVSFFTNSASDPVPTAPVAFATADTASADMS